MLTVMFDLDGTLLPMDYDEFEKGYFSLLVRKLMPLGLAKDEIIDGVWAGTKAMVANDGSRTNEAAFWERFNALFYTRFGDLRAAFMDYYETDFDKAIRFCGKNALIPEVIRELKKQPCRLVVATNPIFPEDAIKKRVRWAGLEPDDFVYISTYENSHYCKPNPDYYREILSKLNAAPGEALMVGNDMTEDLAAQEAGIRTFIITDWLLNKQGLSLEHYPHGDWNAAKEWIGNMLKENRGF